MSKRLEARLAQIAELRRGEPTPEAIKTLQTILGKDQGAAVARAAELVAEWSLFDLQEALVQAFRRLRENGLERDPQCWGKLALIRALQSLGWHDPEVYTLGCRTVQPEPVWGGQEDSAPALRALSAIALADCPGIRYEQATDILVYLLTDPAWNVRAAAAKAIAQLGYPGGAPLLKLRVLLGDSEPRVMGACLDGLLHLTKADAVPFIQELLASPDPALKLEAVCALAAANVPQAVKAVSAAWKAFPDPRARKAIIAALASSPAPEAAHFLLERLGAENRADGVEALMALAPRFRDAEVKDQAAQAIQNNPNPKLREELSRLLKTL